MLLSGSSSNELWLPNVINLSQAPKQPFLRRAVAATGPWRPVPIVRKAVNLQKTGFPVARTRLDSPWVRARIDRELRKLHKRNGLKQQQISSLRGAGLYR